MPHNSHLNPKQEWGLGCYPYVNNLSKSCGCRPIWVKSCDCKLVISGSRQDGFLLVQSHLLTFKLQKIGFVTCSAINSTGLYSKNTKNRL